MTGSVVVVLHHVHPRGVDESLRRLSGIRLIETESDEEAVERLGEASVLVSFRWRPEFLVPTLGWVQSISAGVEQFPIQELKRRGVVLTSARGVHGPQVAEHVFALLLAMTRGVGAAMRDAEHRRWKQRTGHELGGKTMGILGLGTIGEEVARRAAAWGMDVIGVKRDPRRYRGAARRVYGPDGVSRVAAAADVLVVALPDGPDTRSVVDAEILDLLGPGWLVNVGRGPLVDEAAVLRALDEGELRGAGLDVFTTEPLDDSSPLWAHPRVVLTPHVAGLSPEYGPRLAEIFSANLEAFTGDGRWVNRV